MNQYIELGKRILNEGQWVQNERTGKKCLTVINADFTYKKGEFPLDTTRKSFWKAAVAELLGYIRGYDNAQQFSAIGANTWTANSENPVWKSNPHYKGYGDIGRAYGVVARDFGGLDTIRKVYDNLRQGIDDRGEIITFWKPDEFDKACLRPCMYSHHFSILGGKLYLNSTQRSADYALGTNFNMVQVYVFLALMSQICGLEMGKAYHKMVNVHLYEDQVDLFKTQMMREPFSCPEFKINPNIKTLEDVETWVTVDDFEVSGYNHHPGIKYPFSV